MARVGCQAVAFWMVAARPVPGSCEMFQKVLVPLDGTEMADSIVPYVSQIAGGLKSRVLLLSVVDPEELEFFTRLEVMRVKQSLGGFVPGVAVSQPVIKPQSVRAGEAVSAQDIADLYARRAFERLEGTLKRHLESIAAHLAAQDVQATILTSFGEVSGEIVGVAEREACDLIAMSTHGRNLLGRGMLGSVTDKVVHLTRVPVLTIRPEEAQSYRQGGLRLSTVVVPLDGSLLAETALPYARELARRLSLRLVLARVVDIGVFATRLDEYDYISTIPLDEQLVSLSEAYLKGVVEKLAPAGLDVKWVVLRGDPAQQIVKLAQETPGTLVVMSTHGRSGIRKLVVGSVAEKVVRSSAAPVLIVPPQAAAS